MPEYKQRPDAMHLLAWHGAPMAAILHAFRAILGILTPPEFRLRRALRSSYKAPMSFMNGAQRPALEVVNLLTWESFL
jgi:hypothetical protein